jgi:hypothetical protein
MALEEQPRFGEIGDVFHGPLPMYRSEIRLEFLNGALDLIAYVALPPKFDSRNLSIEHGS